MTSFAHRWTLIALVVVFSPAALADGIILPPVAVPQLPSMPQQRGLIVFQDGVEKLIVESPFKGEGNELAWIVPTPAQPTEVSKAAPGVFTTLEWGLQPQVIADAKAPFYIGLFLVAWALFMFAAGRFVPLQAFLLTLGLAMLVAVGAAMFRTAGLDHAFPAPVGAVRSSGVTRVGSFDVQTLEAKSGPALNEWLASHGFRALPENGVAIASDYASKGWRFVVAKLRREGSGYSRPHPLAITFPAMAPVYPMRMTQLAGSDLRLDLFVLAPQQARVNELRTTYCDRLTKIPADEYDPAFLMGKKFRARLGLPALLDLAKDGGVVTWLQGELKNAQLGTDFSIAFTQDASPVRPTVYTEDGVKRTGRAYAMLMAGFLVLVGSFFYTTRKRGREKLVAILAVISVTAVGFFAVNKATCTVIPHVNTTGFGAGANVGRVIKTLQAYPDMLARMSVQDIERYFRDALKGETNPYTGEPLAFEEAPGDLVIAADANGVVVRTYTGPEPYDRGIGRPRETRVTGN